MKQNLLLLLLSLISAVNYSQSNEIDISENDKITYLDSTHASTKSKDYYYYKIIKDYKLEKNNYSILEYYKSGVLHMEATSSTKEGYPLEGKQSYFYENGNKKSERYYDKGKAIGKTLSYYENGKLKEEGEYAVNEKEPEKRYKINQFWSEDGLQKIVDGSGFYEEEDKYSQITKGELKNGYKEGVWESTSKKSSYGYKEAYKDGKLISGVSTDKTGKRYRYKNIEVKPEPKKGMSDFYNFIAKKYRIFSDLPKGLRGKVYITFVIEKDGSIVDAKVVKDLGYGTGDEAIRVVTDYNGFAPGEQRGQKVRCSYSLPISIQNP